MIFIYSGLTGNDEAHILAFGISGGNEDFMTWNMFNSSFTTACPSVLFVKEGHAYSKFVFVSYTDKGLDKSLAETFPRDHATNCVHHIKQNVKTQFGPKAAEMVFPIPTAFLTMQEETLLSRLQTKSASAYEYLGRIPMEQWHNKQWVMMRKLPPTQRLPPRYGVVTSNTSECFNSMIDDYRSEGGTDLLEGTLHRMM